MNDKSYIRVGDSITREPLTIDGLATVQDAIGMMREHGVSSLVVDRRYAGDEYGIVTSHDIAKHVAANERSAERVNVYEVMSKPVISVDASMNVKYAVRLLVRFRLHRCLVLEQGNLIGVITLRDLVIRDNS